MKDALYQKTDTEVALSFDSRKIPGVATKLRGQHGQTIDNTAYMPYAIIMRFVLKLYETTGGRCQVREYLRGSAKDVRSEAGWLLTRLQEDGDRLDRPATGFLEDGIYELRIIVERNQHRILYFFSKQIIVATNAFLKKSRRIPQEEIEKARNARLEWLRREQE